MAFWYVSSVAYAAVAPWTASTAYTVGQIVRQRATPTVGNERCFVVTTAGTSGSAEPAWAIGSGGVTTDGSVTWQEITGVSTYAWGAPGARLPAVLNKIANGDTIFVSQDHGETYTGSSTISIASVQNNGSSILCVNRAGNVPPQSSDLTTGALVTSTASLSIQPVGLAFIYGVTFRAGVGSTGYQFLQMGSNAAKLILRNCRLELATTASNAQVLVVVKNDWENVTTKFAAIGQSIYGDGPELTWTNSATVHAVDPTGTVPTYLIGSGNMIVHLAGLDLSDLGAKIIDHTGNPNGQYIDLRNCKLSASFSPTSPFLLNAAELIYVNCDSGPTNYKTGKFAYTGAETTETTIVRTGGATDGATPQSRKIVTNGNPSKLLPFKGLPLAVWVTPTGSAMTATLYGVWGGAAVPNNDDIWVEVEYEGDSGSPQGAFATSRPLPLAVNAPLASDASGWGGSTTPFKITVSITPQKAGPVYLTVCAARTSSTFYIDPKLAVA